MSGAFASDENAAHYYRQVLHNTLLAGATGWIAWNNTDFDLPDQDPYRHHPFEMRFGVTDAAGVPKPQLGEVRAFADLLRSIDFAGCRRPPAQTALVVPSYMERAYPFTEAEDRTLAAGALRQAYVAAREADLPVGLMREEDGLAAGRRLYLVPSTKQLTAPGWRALERFARDGAVVYLSYCAGSHGVQPAHLPRGGQRARPCLPAGAAGRGRGGRRGPAGPPRAAATAGGSRLVSAVHLPARAHGGRHAPGQPRADVPDL